LRLAHGQDAELATNPNDPRYYHDPSYNRLGSIRAGRSITGVNPVEWISYQMVTPVLSRHGFVLPDERQWEFACRAGTHTTWFSGDGPGSMYGYGNFADECYLRNGGGGNMEVFFDDGHYCHAPVGSFKPNQFGLYDMLGNVFEMMADRVHGSTPTIVLRGGSWLWPVMDSRCAYRGLAAPVLQAQNTGLRVARNLD
jgi:formylglycine-generating enzyme required for sulfatase activity